MNNIVIWIFLGGIILSLISSISHMKEDINRINISLNIISKQVGISNTINDELKDIILDLVAEDKKVKAIKEYRTATGVGLIEAKKHVDSLNE